MELTFFVIPAQENCDLSASHASTAQSLPAVPNLHNPGMASTLQTGTEKTGTYKSSNYAQTYKYFS